MKLPKGTRVFAIVVVALALLGSGVYYRIKGGETGDDVTEQELSRPVVSAAQTFPADVANPVRGAEVVRDTLVVSVSATAEAASFQQAPVHAQVGGPVKAVRVRENALVRAGDVLIEIDPIELQFRLERAEMDLRNAQATFDELMLLEDAITDPVVRAAREKHFLARSGLERAELALREAELDLERTQVRAPFSGRVANLRVVPGQWINGNAEILTIANLDPIRVDAYVMEGEIIHLSLGRGARVEFSAYPGERFLGTIETINPIVDPDTRAARVTVSVPNPEGRILPGFHARVMLETRRFPDRILVPVEALLERDRSNVVFVYQGDDRGGVAMWRYVRTGLRNDEEVEILYLPGEDRSDPLQPGEIVLTAGHGSLTHQAPVRLVENVRAAGGRPD